MAALNDLFSVFDGHLDIRHQVQQYYSIFRNNICVGMEHWNVTFYFQIYEIQ